MEETYRQVIEDAGFTFMYGTIDPVSKDPKWPMFVQGKTALVAVSPEEEIVWKRSGELPKYFKVVTDLSVNTGKTVGWFYLEGNPEGLRSTLEWICKDSPLDGVPAVPSISRKYGGPDVDVSSIDPRTMTCAEHTQWLRAAKAVAQAVYNPEKCPDPYTWTFVDVSRVRRWIGLASSDEGPELFMTDEYGTTARWPAESLIKAAVEIGPGEVDSAIAWLGISGLFEIQRTEKLVEWARDMLGAGAVVSIGEGGKGIISIRDGEGKDLLALRIHRWGPDCQDSGENCFVMETGDKTMAGRNSFYHTVFDNRFGGDIYRAWSEALFSLREGCLPDWGNRPLVSGPFRESIYEMYPVTR